MVFTACIIESKLRVCKIKLKCNLRFVLLVSSLSHIPFDGNFLDFPGINDFN